MLNNNKSVKLNYIYNLILTASNLLFPLITSPYISATLGATNIGKVNYAFAISNWLVLLASFGIPTYGIREIARNRNDKEKLSIAFWDLIIIKIIFTILIIGIYTVIIFSIPNFKAELTLYLVMIILIVLNIFTIDWFYQGIEEYGFITIRSIIFKIISIVLLFAIVKGKNDYVAYALITIFATAFNNILNYVHSKKYVTWTKHKVDFKKYLSELKVFFFSSLVISVYVQLDQVILGTLSGAKELAYYVRGRQVTNIGLSLTTALTTVLIPKAAYLYDNNFEEYKRLLQTSINYIYLISLPCVVGILSLSKEIMYLFGGMEFVGGSLSLAILSILIFIIALGTWQFNQILLPMGEEKRGLHLQILAAIISLGLNFLLVPRLDSMGASIAAVLTEGSGTFIGTYIIIKNYKNLNIKYVTKSAFKYVLAVFFMGISVAILKYAFESLIISLLLSLIIAPIVYLGSIIVLKDQFVIALINSFLIKIKSKFRKA